MSEFIPPATRFIDLPSPFQMKDGGALHGARMAFETWGRLDARGNNAILIHTGLLPDAHAASRVQLFDRKPRPVQQRPLGQSRRSTLREYDADAPTIF